MLGSGRWVSEVKNNKKFLITWYLYLQMGTYNDSTIGIGAHIALPYCTVLTNGHTRVACT